MKAPWFKWKLHGLNDKLHGLNTLSLLYRKNIFNQRSIEVIMTERVKTRLCLFNASRAS